MTRTTFPAAGALLLLLAGAAHADKRATQATFDGATGAFSIPPRTAVVFVED
jgi:hypothetical protein